jgi:hypothetical protein
MLEAMSRYDAEQMVDPFEYLLLQAGIDEEYLNLIVVDEFEKNLPTAIIGDEIAMRTLGASMVMMLASGQMEMLRNMSNQISVEAMRHICAGNEAGGALLNALKSESEDRDGHDHSDHDKNSVHTK